MVTVGFVSAGAVLNTNDPEPVSSETTEIKLALDGVVKKVATPVPRPDTPVAIGKPVALVSVPLEGVPRAPPLTTGAPAEPTLTAKAVATPVPKPDTPVAIGKPVAFVSVTDAGVLRIAPAPNVATPVTPNVLDADKVVNAPAAGVVPPIVAPLIVPPVMATELASCVDIVPKPVMSLLGTVLDAVNALVPLPLR